MLCAIHNAIHDSTPDSDGAMNIFFHHVGAEGSSEDFPKTVFQRRDLSVVEENIPGDSPWKQAVVQTLEREFPTNTFNCWGVPAGGEIVVQRLQEGDTVLLVESARIDGTIPALGVVKVFVPQPFIDLSNALWGSERFPFVFFFDTEVLEYPWIRFLDDIGYKERFNPRGQFLSVGESRLERFGGASGFLSYVRSEFGVRDPAGSAKSPIGGTTKQDSDEYSEADFEKAVRTLEELDASVPLDDLREVSVRIEQGFIRQQLFRNGRESECMICGRVFPVNLLRAAHIKRRADCTPQEKRDYQNNVVPMCTFGCDELFERGYIVVLSGRVAKGRRVGVTSPVEDYIARIADRPCLPYYRGSSPYFDWHATSNH